MLILNLFELFRSIFKGFFFLFFRYPVKTSLKHALGLCMIRINSTGDKNLQFEL